MDKKTRFVAPKNKNDLTPLLSSLIMKQRVAVFIDSANLYYAVNRADLQLDYFQISRWFKKHCKLTILNFYTAYDPLDDRQKDFFSDLENNGFTLIKKPIKVFEDSIKGNMDIELAVDALMLQDQYDVIVLISGDGDFRALVQALEKLEKQTIILGVGGFTSYELHQEADNYFFLNRIKEVWHKTKRTTKSQATSLPAKTEKKLPSAHPKTEPTSNEISQTKKTPQLNSSKKSPSKKIPKPSSKNPPVKVKIDPKPTIHIT